MTNSRGPGQDPVPGRGLAVEKHWSRTVVVSKLPLSC